MMVPLRLDAVIDWHRSTGLLVQRGFRHGVVFLYPTLPLYREGAVSCLTFRQRESDFKACFSCLLRVLS